MKTGRKALSIVTPQYSHETSFNSLVSVYVQKVAC